MYLTDVSMQLVSMLFVLIIVLYFLYLFLVFIEEKKKDKYEDNVPSSYQYYTAAVITEDKTAFLTYGTKKFTAL